MMDGMSLNAAASALQKPVVFILHPSDLLTDHRLNGDGLVACDFLRELVRRGYRLHVACREVDLLCPFPDSLTLYPIARSGLPEILGRVEYMIRARLLLTRLRRSNSIHIVHQMNPVYAGLSLGLAGCGLPTLLGTYVARWPEEDGGSFASRAKRQARRFVAFLQQVQASKILLTTPAAMDQIASPRRVQHKIVQMNHGVDAVMFSPSGQPPAYGPASILFYTSVTRKKGIFTLLAAFEKVARTCPDASLSVVGRGEDWDEVRRVVAGMACRDRIAMRGFIPRYEAPDLFRRHAIYCLPSHGEPLGGTALEGMACGKPLVVTNTGGLPYVLAEDGGIKVPENDPDALAEALLQLISAPDMQKRMGAANRARIEAEFTWQKVVDKLERVYADLVRSDGRKGEAER
jgi:glycosyltransferase involved in cell wall biosynthesis